MVTFLFFLLIANTVSAQKIHISKENNVFWIKENNQVIKPQNLALPAGQFVDISNSNLRYGLSFIPWEQNLGKEQWILRQEGSAQNFSWPGQAPVDISISEPIILSYTLIIHKGNRNKVPLKKNT